MKFWKRSLCLLLAVLLSSSIAACGSAPTPLQETASPTVTAATEQETTAAETVENPTASELPCTASDAAIGAAEFSVNLLRNAEIDGETCIFSPYSVLTALAMTANGADGETLTQMEETFGMSVQDLTDWLSALCAEAGPELVSANGIWISQRDGFALLPEFAQTNEERFQARIEAAPFDEQTLDAINQWVSEHTKQRIPNMLDGFSPAAAMVLVNALTFDAAWDEPYTEHALSDGTFTAADGTVQKVTMMCCEEYQYLDDGMATGFCKDYAGGRYYYAALLPKEGVSMEDYLASLSGRGLLAVLENVSQERVDTWMPAYQAETSADLTRTLQTMGIEQAFSSNADFSKIGTAPLYIDQVVHKTYMKVFAGGTEAAAATAIMMVKGASLTQSYKEVILDRPYVMAIVDRETEAILFLGVVNSVDEG